MEDSKLCKTNADSALCKDRADIALCKDRESCGGCVYQGVPYEEQLANKFGEVKRLLDDKKIKYGELLPIEPAPSRFAYRNKMEYTFGDMVKDGPMTLGMHKKGHFMSIVTVDDCKLVHEDFNKILKATLDFVNEHGYTHYHKRCHTGLMRHLIIRRGVRTGEILVNICTASDAIGAGVSADSAAEQTAGALTDMPPGNGTCPDVFDEAAYAKMLQELKLENRIVGVLRTINDRLADAVYCDELRILDPSSYPSKKKLTTPVLRAETSLVYSAICACFASSSV